MARFGFRRERTIQDSADRSAAPYLSIVIPAYNEARRLPPTIRRLQKYLGAQDYTHEIVVVANGCTDDTIAVVTSLLDDVPGLRLLTIPERGKGIASKTGALQGSGEVIFLCDADLSMPPERLADFLRGVEHTDIVVGSREAEGSRRFDEPWLRHLMGRIFNYMTQAVAVPGIRDTQCGFKAFRRSAALDLFRQQHLTGFAFDVELLYLAKKYSYSVLELGIEWHFDEDTRVRPGVDTLRMVTELLLIRVRDLLGGYRARTTSGVPQRGDLRG